MTTNFTINECGDAFDILSKSLYSSPQKACVREIAMNAVDATVENGAPKPVEIVYDSDEQLYTVRDYGKGMSPEFVTELYTHYFSSTKKASKNQTGMFGLGSKSPFAVTNAFDVETIHNGKKYYWVMGKKEHEAPTATLVKTEETSELSGTKISISGIRRDALNELGNIMYNFKLKGWDVSDLIEDNMEKLSHSSAKYPMPSRIWRNNFNVKVGNYVFGNVSFPEALSNTLENMASDVGITFEKINVSFMFNKGDVNLTPSREELSYDDKTCNAIINTFAKYLESWKAVYDEFENLHEGDFTALKEFAIKYPNIVIENRAVEKAMLKATKASSIVKVRVSDFSTSKVITPIKNSKLTLDDIKSMDATNTFNHFTFAKSIQRRSCLDEANEYSSMQWLLLTDNKNIDNGFKYFNNKVARKTTTSAGPRKSGFYVGSTMFYFPEGRKHFYSEVGDKYVSKVGMKVCDPDKPSTEKTKLYITIAQLTGKIVAVKWCKDPTKYEGVVTTSEAKEIAKKAASKLKVYETRIHAQLLNLVRKYGDMAKVYAKLPTKTADWLKASFGEEVKKMLSTKSLDPSVKSISSFYDYQVARDLVGNVITTNVITPEIYSLDFCLMLLNKNLIHNKIMEVMDASEAAEYLKAVNNFYGC